MGQTQRQLADTLGWRRERLSHMLKGRSVMALEDMFLLIGAIGGGWAEIAGAVGHGAAGVQAHELRQRRFYLEQLLEHNDAALAAAERNARSSYRSATTRQSSR